MHGDESVNAILIDAVASAACPKCGAMLGVEGLPPFSDVQCPECSAEFQVPARFGNFMLLQLLGAGGMGGVYRALDEALNREVAIKVMLKSLGDDPQFVESFQREAQAAAQLNHRHIAQIYSFGQEQGQPYIAMELVSGGSLDKMLETQGPLDPAVAVKICMQIAEGLSLAAEAGMVHGDIKPENILFDQDKNAKLVDFGLSAMQSGPGNDVWGTPYYIAPEKVRRQKADHRSDIYSLGGTLYHIIAGIPPFEGVDATAVVKARFEGPPKSLQECRKGIPDEVEALVMRMLALEPQTRYPTYGSLLGDMRRYLAKAGPIKMTKSSKRIMIKGRQGAQTGKVSTTGNLTATGEVAELPPGMTAIEDVEEEESEELARRRGCRTMALMGVGLVALAALMVGGFFLLKTVNRGKREAAERLQIETSQSKARESIAKSVANARKIAENAAPLASEALGYAQSAAEAVVEVLGAEVRSAMIPPEPAEKPQAAAQEPAQEPEKEPAEEAGREAAGETAKEASKEESKESAKEADKEAEKESKEKSTEKSKEQSKASTKAKSKGKSKDEGKAKGKAKPLKEAAASAVAEPEAAAPVQLEELPKVVGEVHQMYLQAYAVKQAVTWADRTLYDIEQQAVGAEGFANVTIAEAEKLAKLSNAILEQVNAFNNSKELVEAGRRVAQLRRDLEGVKSELESIVMRQKLDRIEAEKRAQAEAEALKKQQAEEARQQKIAQEIAQMRAAVASTTEQLKELRFRDVTREIKAVIDSLESDEARDVGFIALERVNRLSDFLEYLVKTVPGYKAARGWAVDGATTSELSVGGRKIKWSEIFAQRMEIVAELINGLVVSDEATKQLRLRERCRLKANAAICLQLYYSDHESAHNLARRLANEAATQFEIDADSIKQLLPELFE